MIVSTVALEVISKGIVYYPAWKHYGKPTVVLCDFCNRSNLTISMGYQTHDMCLQCCQQVADMQPQQGKSIPIRDAPIRTRMLQDCAFPKSLLPPTSFPSSNPYEPFPPSDPYGPLFPPSEPYVTFMLQDSTNPWK